LEKAFLGQGTYGIVSKCLRLEDKQTVAIKLLRKYGPYLKQAKMELAALNKLKNLDADKCNLVRWHQVFTDRGHVCLEFEHLDKSLYDLMAERSGRSMPLKQIRPLVYQLAVALTHLKAQGIIHADLKLENVMLVNHIQQPFRIKLIDFGLARLTTEIKIGSYIQSRPYRSPEILLGLPFTEAIDIWSLGCLAAVLYLGTQLYPGKTESIKLTCLDDLTDTIIFINLLKGMLHLDPSERLTPSQVVEHQFITMQHLHSMIPLSFEVRSNFHLMDQFKKRTVVSEKDETLQQPSSTRTVLVKKNCHPNTKSSCVWTNAFSKATRTDESLLTVKATFPPFKRKMADDGNDSGPKKSRTDYPKPDTYLYLVIIIIIRQHQLHGGAVVLWPRANVSVIGVEPQGSPPGHVHILVRAVGTFQWTHHPQEGLWGLVRCNVIWMVTAPPATR
uniref:Protein kinase domain-containing protein n=1 Tax=Cynoglossus semilaevis TaxID=244447 RepID=A0A3P8UJQ7_CYNSE